MSGMATWRFRIHIICRVGLVEKKPKLLKSHRFEKDVCETARLGLLARASRAS